MSSPGARGADPGTRPGARPVLLGIDSGQTVCKAAVFSLDGAELGVAGARSPTSSPHPRWVERDIPELNATAAAAIAGALSAAAASGPVEVQAISVCGHGDGVYLLDPTGEPVRPAILATDSRAHLQAARFAEQPLATQALELTGQVPFAGAPPSVLAWLAEHEPQSLQRAAVMLHCKDVIRAWLCGDWATDTTEASASFVDLSTRRWSQQALDLYGLGDLGRLLPTIRPSTDVCGTLSQRAADATGLPAGIPVVTGAHDVAAAAVGLGAAAAGQPSVVLGTFSINQVIATTLHPDPRWQARSFISPDTWLHMSTSAAGASCLDWALRQLGPWTPSGEPDPVAAIALADAVRTNPHRMRDAPMFLPFLFGAPVPVDPGAGWVHLRGWHDRAEMLYAVLEGVAFNHRFHLDLLAGELPMTAPLRAAGGGARSAVWTQLLADVTARPVQVSDAGEAGARGACLLAGTGIGLYDGVPEAMEQCVRVARHHEPTSDPAYQQRYLRYLDAIFALGPA